MNKMVAALSALVVSLAFAAPVQAAYLVNTGSGTPETGGWTLSSGQSLAGYFTLSSAATINSVEGFIGGSGGSAKVTIYADGSIPSIPMFSASFSTINTGNGIGDQWQGVFGQSWALAAGSYWVGFDDDATVDYMTFTGTPNPLSQYAISGEGGNPWNRFDGLNIGIRIAGIAGAVPEPTSWALMITGFGLIGGIMRRGRIMSVIYT